MYEGFYRSSGSVGVNLGLAMAVENKGIYRIHAYFE